MTISSLGPRGHTRMHGPLVAATILLLAGVGAGCSSDDSGGDSAVASDCKPAHTVKTLKEGVLTTVNESAMPFADIDGKLPVGMDGLIIQHIAKLECLELSSSLVDAAAVIPSVQTGKADVGFGDWYRTEERLKTVTMSDGMYMDANGLVSKDGVSTFEELKSLSVGGLSGTNYSSGLKAYLGGDYKEYPTEAAVYQDLKSGRIDVAADSLAAAGYTLGKDFQTITPESVPAELGTAFDPTQVGIVINPDSTGLLEAINEDLAAMREDGTLLEIAKKYNFPEASLDLGE
jgi:polar amino acid transport system substrate-binding protein